MKLLDISSIKEFCSTEFNANPIQTLKDVTYPTEQGEYVVVVGDNSTGKISYLNILTTFDKATSDEVLLNGRNILSIRRR